MEHKPWYRHGMSWWEEKPQAVVEAPTELPAERLAELERACREAEAAFNADARALRNYSMEHTEKPFAFKTGDTLRIQTFVNDAARQRLERDFRKSYGRRNKAWSARADFLLGQGLIR